MTMLDPIKFIKGMDQKPDPELGEFQTITNMDLSRVGIAKAVKSNSPIRSYPGQYVHSIITGQISIGDRVLDGVSDGMLMYNGTNLKTFTQKNFLSGTSQNSRIYVTNETDGIWDYNGTAMYRAGSPVPSSACSAAAGAGGGFTGDYTIVVTFTNGNGYVGNPSAEASVSLTAQEIDLTNIPVNSDTDYNITGRKIWIFGGTTPLYSSYVLLKTINDNSTVAVSGLDTTDVDTLTVLETDNTIPPLPHQIVSHYDTFFGIGIVGQENYLAYSKSGKGEQWPPTQLIKVSVPGDAPRSIISWNGVLLIGTKSRIFELVGSPGSGTLSTNFYLKETQTRKGMISTRGNVACQYGLFHLCEDGIYKFDGNVSTHTSHTVQNVWDVLNKDDDDAIGLSCGVFYDNKLLMSVPINGSEVPNITIMYDFETDQWSTHDRGYYDFYPDYTHNDLYVATDGGVEKWRGGSQYLPWTIKTKDLSNGTGEFSSWGEYEFDIDATCTANIYMDDVLVATENINTIGRQVLTRTFPNQIARRVAIELTGAQKSTQDKIYSIRVNGEIIGEKGEP